MPKVSHRHVGCVLLAMLIFLELAYVIAYKTQSLLPLFDLNGEANIPAWYTSTLLSVASFLAFLAHIKQSSSDRWVKAFWLLLSVACLLVLLDEIAQFHEKFDLYLKIKWVYFYAPVGVFLIFFLARHIAFHWREQPHLRSILVGILIGFFLSLGFEYISYLGLASHWQKIEYMLEEGAEILGASLILIGCIQEAGFFHPHK